MRLASPPITITVDGAKATLRPSLRAAYLLEQKHGFKAVLQGVNDGNVGIIADILAVADDEETVGKLLRETAVHGIIKLDFLRPALIEFLAVLIGLGDDEEEAEAAKKPIALTDFFEQLFEIATGWLGWTPDQAWAATPREIIAAQRGFMAQRNALLTAIFGKPEEHDPREEVSEEQVLSGLATLKANAMRGKR